MKEIPKISTGEPSTLKTYRNIAMILNGGNKKSSGVQFIDKKIKESTDGQDAIVIASEGQVLYLLFEMLKSDTEKRMKELDSED